MSPQIWFVWIVAMLQKPFLHQLNYEIYTLLLTKIVQGIGKNIYHAT